MKNLILAIAALTAFQSNARSIQIPLNKTAEIVPVALDPNGIMVQREIEGGTVLINQVEGRIELKLFGPSTCPKDMMCAAVVGPMVYDYSAEIESVTTGYCGAKIYRAVTDRRPVDGMRTEITVVDNTKMTCDIPVAYLTQIEILTQGPFSERPEVNHFGGTQLTTRTYTIQPLQPSL